jgi:hypothetical protein
MIRLATRSDINVVTDLICEFLQNTSYHDHTDNVDINHIKQLVYVILQQGYIWLLYKDNEAVGLLAAVRERNIWLPNKITLRELVWYVREQYRTSVLAGRLFITFCNVAQRLLETDNIVGYFTTRMSTTADYDLERRGFRLTEKLYFKD